MTAGGYGGIRLDFEDLGFTVQDRASGHKKAILSGITGSCVPGRLFALMGEWVQLPSHMSKASHVPHGAVSANGSYQT